MLPSRRLILGLAALAFVVLTLMTNLAGTLRAMHPVGGVSGSVTDLASPFISADDASDIVASWRAWEDGEDRRTGPVRASPAALAGVWLVLDSFLFAPLLTTLAATMSRRRAAWKPRRWRAWLRQAPLLAGLYLVFDLLENALTAVEIYSGWGHLLLRFASGMKLLFFLLASLPILFSFLVPNRAPAGVTRLRPLLLRLRIPVVVSMILGGVLLFLPESVRPQLIDVMRTWVQGDDPAAFFWALAAATALSATLWAVGVIEMTRCPEKSDVVSKRRFLVHLVVAVLFLALSPLLLKRIDFFWPAGLIVGFALAANLALLLVPSAKYNDSAPFTRDARGVLMAVTAAPLYYLGVSYLSAVDLINRWETTSAALGVGLILLLGSALTAWRVEANRIPTLDTDSGSEQVAAASTWRRRAELILEAVAAAAVVGAVVLIARPLEAGWAMGSIAALFIWLIVLAAFLGAAEQVVWPAPRGLFRQLGFRKVPVVLALAVVYLLAGQFDSAVGFHEARMTRGASPAPGGHSSAAREGVALSELARRVPPRRDGETVRPLFLIAASGGGARAAYWTSLVLNCLFGNDAPGPAAAPACEEGPRWSNVLLASGISGGSVGLAMFEAQQLSGGRALDLDRIFADGFLDPTFSRLMFVDIPNGLIRHDGSVESRVQDRAVTLEKSWEDRVPAMGRTLFGSQANVSAETFLPVLMLNSASVTDGCRINVSVLTLAPSGVTDEQSTVLPSCRTLEDDRHIDEPLVSTRDVRLFVCENQDLRLSTAALLSARFPYVSPTGALTTCSSGKARRVFAVDGGYVDSSAASPLAELVDRLVELVPTDAETCVQPVVLQIDNGYADLTRATERSRPRELLAPIAGVGAAGGANADMARQALYIAARPRCEAAKVRDTYLHVFPRVRPGVAAPLGWSLSRAARDDLENQLSMSPNMDALCTANYWLGGSCNPPSPIHRPAAVLGEPVLPTNWVVTLMVSALGVWAVLAVAALGLPSLHLAWPGIRKSLAKLK